MYTRRERKKRERIRRGEGGKQNRERKGMIERKKSEKKNRRE